MKRVLVISYYWPPSGGSGVQRWVKFAKYLPSMGWQPVIYTPENPELIAIDETLVSEIPSEVEVVKRHITEPYGILRGIKSILRPSKATLSAQKGEVNPINSQKKTLGQKISLFIRGNFFIPDPRCWWIGPSVKFLKKYLADNPVDVIVSTGPPHSMHLIARKLSRETGLPWVADFRDPWTKMFYFKHLSLTGWAERRHEKLEKAVLDDATAVVAVSPLVQDEFRAMTDTPVELITNGYDEDDFNVTVERGTFFNVLHTGLFASDGDPEMLWKALSDISEADEEFRSQLRINLCGKTDPEVIASIKSAGLSDNLTDHGYCPHSQAVAFQKQASLLILPLRKEPEYRATLPGKLFEYLASGRPVLGIGQRDGAMARILDDTQVGITYDWNEYDQIRSFIEASWMAHKAGKLDSEILYSQFGCSTDAPVSISSYSRRSTAASMASLLEKIS